VRLAEHETASSFGHGATLGVKVTPVQMLSLGAPPETRSHFRDLSFDVPGGKDELRFDPPQVLTLGVARSVPAAAARQAAAAAVPPDESWCHRRARTVLDDARGHLEEPTG
jgi:hypothetical protein